MYTCNICNTRILQSSPEIQCHSCNNNHAHLRCINRFRFNHHSWNCSSCPEPPSLPFNHILHNDDFKAAVRNFFSDTNTNITKLNSLCFNPLLTDPISHHRHVITHHLLTTLIFQIPSATTTLKIALIRSR